MATTLQPGMRRTLTVDQQLELMALAGFFPTPESPSAPYGPTDPGAPLPFTRTTGSYRLGRQRDSRLDALDTVPQYAILANPKLTNTDFIGDIGWSTTGSVSFANGSAVLKEAATTQSRLNQVFVFGEHDRFLSFTLDGIALDDVAAGPDDAFEVALLDANTGASLLGLTSLTRSDAFLNLQANGQEHLGANVSRIANADGSLTYLVDLGRVAAGTVANLSFDLIGFAQTGSQITVRDLRIGVPQTQDDSLTLAEDTPAILAALANDLNAQQPGFLPVIVSGPAHGQVAINADGTFSFTPEANWSGDDTFTYKLSDGQVDSNLATVSVTVTPVNDAPVAGDRALATDEDSPFVIDLLANASDVEGSALTVSIISGPTHGVLTQNVDGRFTYTPNANFNGEDRFTYQVSDGEIASNVATVTLAVAPVNDAPTVADLMAVTSEDTPAILDLLQGAFDIEGSPLTFNIVRAPLHGSLRQNADGTFTYTPDANYHGEDSFTYQVNDGELDSNVALVSLTLLPVNDAPTLVDIAATTAEDQPLVIDLLAGARDIEGSPLVIRIVNAPTHGTLTQLADGRFVYQPAANYNGEDRFSYLVSDGELDSNLSTVVLNVTPVNDAPTAGDLALATDEDVAFTGNVLAAANDIDSSLLTARLVAGPQHGQLVLNPDGTFTYTPNANWFGEDSFTFKVDDEELESNLATVRISVASVNDAPLTADAQATTAEDTPLALELRTHAFDVDGDSLLAQITSGPSHGTLAINADGSFTYRPEANYNGEDRFTYQVSDGALLSNVATVTLSVTPVNDAPTVADLIAITSEDTPAVLDLLQGTHDIEGAPLTVKIVRAPAHGTLAQNADGTFTYTPEANYNGEDSFGYQVSDGELDSNVALVSLTLLPINDAPTLVDVSATTAEDEPLVIDLLAGAHDIEGSLLGVRIVAAPAHGTLTKLAEGRFVYRPDANYNGDDSFSCLVNDGELDSNVATVALNVTPVNDAPTAGDLALATDEDIALTGNVLAAAADIDSLLLTARLVAGPQHGRLVLNPDGTFTYTPDANWFGEDSFTFKVDDEELESKLATVRISVASVNDAPVTTDAQATTAEDTPLALDLRHSASDVDGDPLTAQIVVGPAHGTLVRQADGSFTYASDLNYHGEDHFIYQVGDGQASSNVSTVRLTISAVNDAPSAGDDTATLQEDGQVTLALLSNDVDLDGDALSLVIDTPPAHGTLLVNADGTVTYTPAPDWSGEDVFTYHVNDGQLDSAPATVRLIVNAVADAPTLVLTEQPGAVSEVWRTSWETAGSLTSSPGNGEPPLLLQPTLEGWSVVKEQTPGGPEGFEVWRTGDTMKDAGNKKRTVAAAEGNGGAWIELSDAMGLGHQTLGIERTVQTVAGATYTLSMDLAGHLGYSADYTRIGIYVNGVRIGGADNTSPVTGLAWTTKSFSFVGIGGAQTIRIVAEPTKRESNGRGMMIDDIALTETLPPNTVRRDGTLVISAVGASLTDTDGSETLHLSIGALPVGATLTDGTHVFVASEGQTTADITGWALGSLSIKMPDDLVGTFTLSVTATAIESSNGDSASTTSALTIHVLPQIDDPLTAMAVYEAANTACITVRVEERQDESADAAMFADSGITIDWSGTLSSLLTAVPVRTEEWVSDALCSTTSEPSLAEQTGLVVRIGE